MEIGPYSFMVRILVNSTEVSVPVDAYTEDEAYTLARAQLGLKDRHALRVVPSMRFLSVQREEKKVP